MEAAVPMARRVSPLLLTVLMIILVLSLASIYEGINYYMENDSASGSLYLTVGVTFLAISTYILFQTRQRVLRLGAAMQPLNTTLECQKCGFKNIRDFQQGDYVFKRTEDQCPKCNEKTMSIGAIFREVKEKEKAKETAYS